MKGRSWWLIPAVTAVLVNLLPLTSFFNSDDFGLLRAVREHGPFGIWSGHGEPFFRPLVSASVWLDSKAWGLEPFGFHLTNVLLHAANAFLVAILAFLLLRQTDLDKRSDRTARMAISAGVLFALMPCHAEAVAWVSGRTDLLSTFFALAASVVFFSEIRLRLLASALLFGLALCCKESPLLLPAFLAMVAFAVDRPREAKQALVGMAIVLPYLALRTAVIGQAFGGYGATSYLGVGLTGLAKNAAVYAGKAVAPASIQMLNLNGFSGTIDERPLLLFAALVILAFGLALLGGLRQKKGTRNLPAWLVVFGIAGFFVLALPALPLGMNPYTAEGSRFLYLPSVGLCLALGAAFESSGRHVLANVSIALFSVPYGVGLWMQNQAWHDAGEATRQSLNALRDLPGNATLVSVPDSYRGAYMLRNCLDDGVALFGSLRPKIPIVSAYSYEQSDFMPAVEAQGDMVRVKVPGTYGSLLSLEPGASPQGQPSLVERFSPSALIARTSKGFVLTPGGLIVPPR